MLKARKVAKKWSDLCGKELGKEERPLNRTGIRCA
jgi:hypothetical protein